MSLEECMERFIDKIVYKNDKEELRMASSASYIKNELSEKKFYHVN